MDNHNSLFNTNPFEKAFQEFDEDAFFENLHNKVRNKPYFEKYQGFKTTILWLSYLFNLASALTASYAIFWLVNWLTGIALIGYLVAATFLFFLEKIKRKSSTEFWQVFFFRKEFAAGWFGLSVFCLCLSLASSGFGVKEGTEQLSPDAALIATDSLANEYRATVAKLEAENVVFKKQRNHEGIIFHRTQASIKANKKMIADYQSRILALDEQLQGKNDQLTDAYLQEVNLTAWTLVWLTALMELLFEACIAYVWYYYFRSYVERNKVKNQATETIEIPLPEENPIDANAEMMELIQALQHEISVLKATKSSNGISAPLPPNSTNHAAENAQRPTIGFFSESQKAAMGLNQVPNQPVQTCTQLDRAITDVVDDRYTIEHIYTKGGKEKTVRYTLQMVNSRVGQYQRELEEAIKKQMDKEVISNRKQWLAYWKQKKTELSQKLELVNA